MAKKTNKSSKGLVIVLCLLALIAGLAIGYILPRFIASAGVVFYVENGKKNISKGSTFEPSVECYVKDEDSSNIVNVKYYQLDGTSVQAIDTSKEGSYIVEYTLVQNGIEIKTLQLVSIKEIKDTLEVTILMLGNDKAGDSIYIKAGEADILIDGGSAADSADTIAAYLNGTDGTTHSYVEDGKLEYVIGTHGDQDHIAAFVGNKSHPGIFDLFDIDYIIDPNISNKETQVFKNYKAGIDKLVTEKGTKYIPALDMYNNTNGGTRIVTLADGITMEFLYNYYYENKTSDENDYSVCVILRCGEKSIMLNGDLEKDGEAKLIENNTLGKIDVYKSSHHGSYTGSTMGLLNIIKPEYVVCSCVAFTNEYTKNNDNTFPSKKAIENYVAAGVSHFYVTSQKAINDAGWAPANGNITIYTDGTVLEIRCSNSNKDFFDTSEFPIFGEYRSWE